MRRVAALVAAALGATALATATTDATAAPGTALGLTTFSNIVADGQHVFLTGGAGTTAVLVRNANGTADTSITGENGAAGMALSPDGTTLYVALTDANAIAAISTSTLAETARYATGDQTCPATVLPLGDKVWYGYGCGSTGSIGVVDLAGPTVTPAVASIAGAPPLLAGGSAAPNLLFAGAISGSELQSFMISGATLTPAHSVGLAGNLAQIALSKDGSQVLTASGAEYDIARYDANTLTSAGQYGSDCPYPNAVVVAPTGGQVVAGLNSAYDQDIRVFASDGTALRTFEPADNDPNTVLASRGLALDPSATHLYAVTRGNGFALHVISAPTANPTSLTVTAPYQVARAAATTVSVDLLSNGVPLDGTVTLTRRDASGTRRIATLATGADGAAAFTDHAPVGGTVVYTAAYAGTPDEAPAGASTRVTVVRPSPALSIKLQYSAIYAYTDAVVHIHLGHGYNNRTVALLAHPLGQTTRRMLTQKADRYGNLTAKIKVTRNTTFTAVYGGDYRYAPARSSIVEKVGASLFLRLKGFYASSGKSVLYHQGTNIGLFGAVAPSKAGGCVYFDDQVLKNGKYTLDGVSPCVRLSSRSTGTTYYRGANTKVGGLYRFQAFYRGDRLNVPSSTGWVYVRVTK